MTTTQIEHRAQSATASPAISLTEALVRGALAALLDLEPDLEVAGEAASGEEAVDLVRRVRPDVVLMDVDMPGMDGIDAAKAIHESGSATRILIVTTYGRPGFLRRAMQAGASGFVVKDAPARQLADAVRRVHQGLRVDPTLATDSLLVGESPLTAREADVLRSVLDGGSIADIAAAVHLSEGTVRNHLSSVITKTHARNRADAARIAAENGGSDTRPPECCRRRPARARTSAAVPPHCSNVVTVLGLGLCIGYGLLVVSRFSRGPGEITLPGARVIRQGKAHARRPAPQLPTAIRRRHRAEPR